MSYDSSYSEYKKSGTVQVPRHAKAKKNKRPTACKDVKRTHPSVYNNRRDVFCGICGTDATFSHGVHFCTKCEFENLVYLDFDNMKVDIHNCEKENRYYLYQQLLLVHECMECGAVHGPKCPVCGKKMWKKTDENPKCRCTQCGYTK